MFSRQPRVKRPFFLLAILAAMLSACQPVTLSHEGRIDFVQYRSVYVEPIALSGDAVFPDLDSATQLYLVNELRAISGFKAVNGVDTLASDSILIVDLRVDAFDDFSRAEIEYRAVADFQLIRHSGGLIASGEVSSTNTDILEAQEDALDEIALYFLKPYRI